MSKKKNEWVEGNGKRTPGGRGGRGAPAAKVAPSAICRSEDPPYRAAPYPYEVRRRAVQLYTEEGIAAAFVARELGISDGVVYDWAKRYRKFGEAGLRQTPSLGCFPRRPTRYPQNHFGESVLFP